MIDDNVVAALAVTFIFGAPCAVWLVTRVLAHQERMEMLRRGISPPPNSREWRRAVRQGWVPGPTAPPAANTYEIEANYYAQYQMRRGIQVAFVGLALLIGLGFIGYRGDGTFVYGPWLLGGLIPMFVGIAQIIIALMSGAVFAFGRMQPPPGPAGPPPIQRTYGSAQPGQPGPRYEELARPVPPPDRT